jgi:capsular polysaccharide biosynthesis protein
MATRLQKSLLDKILIRAARVFSKHIPYNSKYRPIGVKNLLPADPQFVEYLEINPPYVSTLSLRAEFVEDCSPYVKPIVSVQYPGDYLVTIKDGRVYTHDTSNTAVISGDNYLIDEVSFQWDGEHEKIMDGKENAIFRLKGFTKPKKYPGKVFSMLAGGGPKFYFYHWLIESMPKLYLLKQSGKFDNVDFFLVPNYEYRYQREYLDHFGITADKVINDELDYHIQADELMVCSYVRLEDHHPKWACDFLHDSFIAPAETIKRDKLIYIGRGDSAVNRKVINEHELTDVLKSYGFEIHFLSGISVVEQARLFNSARIVVGVHGAGLTNLVYCEPATKVLEIFPDNYVRHIFYDISNKRGLEYHYLLCPSEGTAEDTWVGQTISLTADIEAIRKKVESMLALS